MWQDEKTNCGFCGATIDRYYSEQGKTKRIYSKRLKKFCNNVCARAFKSNRKNIVCKYCNKEFSVMFSNNDTKFCSKECKLLNKQKDLPAIQCTVCNNFFKPNSELHKICTKKCWRTQNAVKIYDKKRRKKLMYERKTLILNISGSKCMNCGYNKCSRALTFHHKNPEDKKFQLSSIYLANHSIDEILEELNKCLLLCQNCHAELHEKERLTKVSEKYIKKQKQIILIKQKLIEHHGGRCKLCLYNSGIQSLTFHHKDKNQKLFHLSSDNLRKYDYNLLMDESNKCDLLCFNCHMDEEDKQRIASQGIGAYSIQLNKDGIFECVIL